MVKTRRRFLKTAGASTFALSITTGTAIGGDGQSNVDRSFDPSDKDEVRSFLKSINDKSEKKRQNITNSLTEKQQGAIVDYLKVATVETPESKKGTAMLPSNASPPDSADMKPAGSDGYTTRSATGVYVGRNVDGEKLWTFRQRLSYKWWYNRNVEILSASVRPSINFSQWTYVDTISSDRTDFGTYADSYKQGKFQFCVGGKFGCIQTVLPFIEFRCYSKGGARYERRGTPGDCSGASC